MSSGVFTCAVVCRLYTVTRLKRRVSWSIDTYCAYGSTVGFFGTIRSFGLARFMPRRGCSTTPLPFYSFGMLGLMSTLQCSLDTQFTLLSAFIMIATWHFACSIKKVNVCFSSTGATKGCQSVLFIWRSIYWLTILNYILSWQTTRLGQKSGPLSSWELSQLCWLELPWPTA